MTSYPLGQRVGEFWIILGLGCLVTQYWLQTGMSTWPWDNDFGEAVYGALASTLAHETYIQKSWALGTEMRTPLKSSSNTFALCVWNVELHLERKVSVLTVGVVFGLKQLPDGRVIKVGAERFQAPEALFTPVSIIMWIRYYNSSVSWSL
jgi:hypothetical protein